ncbi:unnamed protein product [Calypogeia fissa]
MAVRAYWAELEGSAEVWRGALGGRLLGGQPPELMFRRGGKCGQFPAADAEAIEPPLCNAEHIGPAQRSALVHFAW